MGAPDLKVDEKSVKTNNNATADLETAITLTGFGKFHTFLIGVGGFCFLATGFEYGLHAYILPFAQCDLRITATQMGIINAMFLGGGIICSFFWGVVGDTLGRKKVLMISMAIDGIATIVASWSESYVMFALIRFICGFMCGAPGCLVNSYVGEFCSDKHRSRGICLIGFCWTLAWMLLPAIAWIIIPSGIGIYTEGINYESWRVFVALIGIPNLIASFLIAYHLPETPKFLFVKGREAEALEVLKMMYNKNTGKPMEEYPVSKLVAKYNIEENAVSNPVNDSKNKTVGEICSQMGNQIKQIFSPPHWTKTLLGSAIYFTNMFGYYGLGLWLPELFNRFEAHYTQNPGESVTVCELSRLRSNYTNSSLVNEEEALEQLLSDCGERTINIAVFSNTFIIGAVCCCGNILAVMLTNKVGGRILSVIATLISGISAILVVFLNSEIAVVAVTCLFMTGINTALITISTSGMMLGGFCAFYVYFVRSTAQVIVFSAVFIAAVNSALNVHNFCVVNLFPTSVRGMGVCIGILFGRIGAVTSNLVFGMLIDISCEIPIFLLGGTVIVGGLLCFLMPKNSLKATE